MRKPKRMPRNQLSAFQRRVLSTLRYYENAPRAQWIADDIGAREWQVSQALEWLERHRYIQKV